MKKILGLLGIAVLMSVNTGCTAYQVSKHNSRARENIVKLNVAGDNGEMRATLGIDLLQAADPEAREGYVNAWKADPWGMGKAHATDVAVGALLYKLYKDEKSETRDNALNGSGSAGQAKAPAGGSATSVVNNFQGATINNSTITSVGGNNAAEHAEEE
jgi:hypothetical protein